MASCLNVFKVQRCSPNAHKALVGRLDLKFAQQCSPSVNQALVIGPNAIIEQRCSPSGNQALKLELGLIQPSAMFTNCPQSTSHHFHHFSIKAFEKKFPTHLLNCWDGDFAFESFLTTRLNQIVVNPARAEDDALDAVGILRRLSGVWDDAGRCKKKVKTRL